MAKQTNVLFLILTVLAGCGDSTDSSGVGIGIDAATRSFDAQPPDAAPLPDAPPTNLVANGSFEQPVVGSDGYFVAADAVPGWTLSAGPNQFFIEHGQPFGIPRYTDGVQVACLNSDGAPNVYIEQTFATVIGKACHFSFDMTDEQVAGPSGATVRVDVAGITASFDRTLDTGYAKKTLDFTPTATTTTLRLTDATPGQLSNNNPLIDAIVVTCAP